MFKPVAIAKCPVWGVALLSLLITTGTPMPSWAETVLEKVARTGVLTAGTRTDAVPFAYRNDQQDLQGYSVDMLVLIKTQLEQELGKDITLELVEVTPETRVPMVTERKVDLVCGSTSFTWERNRYVDFSVSYAVTGTGLLVKSGSALGSPESLINKRIGVLSQTTNAQVIPLVQPKATIVTVENAAAGLSALKQGKIDAFAWDGILLEGLRKRQSNPDAYAVVPDRPYTREGIACMMPEDSSKFRDIVDFSLVKFMQGYLQGAPQSVAIVNRWFGPQGVIPIDSEFLQEFFRVMIDIHEQILISGDQS